MERVDRIALMAAIIVGSRQGKFDNTVADEVVAADAVRLAGEIDKQVARSDGGSSKEEPSLFRKQG